MNKNVYISSDRPIKNPSDCIFDYKDFSKTIADSIFNYKLNDPITIAINAPWGGRESHHF